MHKIMRKRFVACVMTLVLLCNSAFLFVGCGNSSTSSNGEVAADETSINEAIKDFTDEEKELLSYITDLDEKAAVITAKNMVDSLDHDVRIVATSVATAEICDKLNIDLVGVASSNISTLPSRYDDVTRIGLAMGPDMEIIASLSPDWILSPASLQSDLQPKYEAIDTDFAFLNLRSVEGMYQSIIELGIIFDRETEALELVWQYQQNYEEFVKSFENESHPKVLILMGLPGSYIIATENSYIGDLVELAGGENVYSGTDQEFLTVNTEDMETKQPDIILRAAHAMPTQVIEMFAEEFETNDIWKHFSAVQNGKVYDLPYDLFGMSANFDYTDALEYLYGVLYGE